MLELLEDRLTPASFRFTQPIFHVSEDAGSAVITVERTGPTDSAAAVSFSTMSQSAVTPNDYDYIYGQMQFGVGAATASFSITIHNDTFAEGTETLQLSLYSPSAGYDIETMYATLAIDDDEPPAPTVGSFRFSQASYITVENNWAAYITVERLGSLAGNASVQFATGDGTAFVMQDYYSSASTLWFGDQQATSSFTVSLINNSIQEPSKYLNLTLAQPSNGYDLDSAQGAATLTITDDDQAPASTFRFASPSSTVSENVGWASLTVERLGTSADSATVSYYTMAGSAGAPADYTSLWNTLTFAPGQTTATINVSITNDTGHESDEYFYVYLTAPSGGALDPSLSSTTVNITDDDAAGGGSSLPASGPLQVAMGANLVLTGGGTLHGALEVAAGASVHFQGGTYWLSGGGTIAGTFTVGADATVYLNGGAFTFASSSAVLVAGTLNLSMGSADFYGSFDATGTVLLTGSSVGFHSAATIAHGTLSGWSTLRGTGTVTLTAAFTWLGGTMTGTGTTLVATGATFTVGGDPMYSAQRYLAEGRVLQNAGLLRFGGYGGISTLSGAVTLHNLTSGTVLAEGDNFYHLTADGPAATQLTFLNEGLFRNTANATTDFYKIVLDNRGVMDILSGALRMRGGGTSAGSMTVAAGARVEVLWGSYDFTATSSVTGAGSLRAEGGVLEFRGGYALGGTTEVTGPYPPSGAALVFHGAASAGTVVLRSGTLTAQAAFGVNLIDFDGGRLAGAGTVTVSNRLLWRSGIMEGSGVTRIAAGAVLELRDDAGRNLDGRYLDVQGQVTWNGQGAIVRPSNSGETFINAPGIPSGASSATPAPASFDPVAEAGALYRALHGGVTGLGTDEDAVYKILEGRTSAQIALIESAYNDTHGRWVAPTDGSANTVWQPANMRVDIETDFQDNADELYRVTQLLRGCEWTDAQANAAAAAIHYAFGTGGIGTDYATIFRFLESDLREAIVGAYQAIPHYANGRADALRADLMSYMGVAPRHRDRALALLDGNRALADAHGLYRALYGEAASVFWRADREQVFAFFRGRPQADVDAMCLQFGQTHGNLAQCLQEQLGSAVLPYVEALRGTNVLEQAVTTLRLALDQDGDGSISDFDGTDEAAIWRTLDGLRSDQRVMVAQLYRQRYGSELRSDYHGEFSNSDIYGNELNKTLALHERGRLNLGERLYYTFQGWGTDDDAGRQIHSEMTRMTTAQIAELDSQYRAASGGQSLHDGGWGDLSGRTWFDFQQALQGSPNTLQEAFLRAQARHTYERDGWVNALNNLLQGEVNNHGANLDRAWQRLQVMYNGALATRHGDPIGHVDFAEFRRLLAMFDETTTSFREARDSSADILANAAGTVAGMAAIVLSGGSATPLVVALAAGAGGASQALTRMGLQGAFTWEELPADIVAGAVNAGTVILGLPAAARQSLINGTAKLGVLRRVAGSTFGSGALGSGISTALSENTWPEGIAAGLIRVSQAASLGGFASSALATTIGAGIQLFQRVSWRVLVRNLADEEAGTLILNPALWRQIRDARAAGQSMEDFLQSAQQTLSQRLDDVADRLRTTLANLGETQQAAARAEIRSLLGTAGTQEERDLLEELAIVIWQRARPQLAGMSNATIRGMIVGSLDETAAIFSNTANGLSAAIRTFHPNIDAAAVESAVIQLIREGHTDSAAIRALFNNTLGTVPNDLTVETLRLLLTRSGGASTTVSQPVVFTGNLARIEAHELAQAIRYGQFHGGGTWNWLGMGSAAVEGTFTPFGTTTAINVSLKRFGPNGERNIRSILSEIRNNMRLVRDRGLQGSTLYAWVNFTADEWHQIAINGPLTVAVAGPNTPAGVVVNSMISDGAFARMLFHTTDGRVVEITTSGVRIISN